MKEEELFYLLALQKVNLVGDINSKKLLYHFGSAKNIFEAKVVDFKNIDRIGSVIVKNLRDKEVFKLAEKELQFIENNNVQVLSYGSDNYPVYLKHCSDAPLLIFSKGNINFEGRKIISVVGTRKITSQGADFCSKMIEYLAPYDPIIISGYAYGVDIVAHKAAIDYNLQTIAVLAHGLDIVYPTAHKKYVNQMELNGGFLTEFWSGTSPEKENFVKRNRIVAGISEATIVVESASKGGSLITANMANDYDREVFAVPGRPTDVYSQGCNDLIKNHKAHLLNSAQDLVLMLNWDLQTELKPIQKQMFVSLTADEQIIYDFLIQNGKELLDIIAINCKFPTNKVSAILLSMELKGLVRPLPGKIFEAI